MVVADLNQSIKFDKEKDDSKGQLTAREVNQDLEKAELAKLNES